MQSRSSMVVDHVGDEAGLVVLGQPVVEGGREEEGLGLVVVAEALLRPRRCYLFEPGPARSPPRRACRRPDHLPWANSRKSGGESRVPAPREGQSAVWRHWRVLTHAPRRKISGRDCRPGPRSNGPLLWGPAWSGVFRRSRSTWRAHEAIRAWRCRPQACGLR